MPSSRCRVFDCSRRIYLDGLCISHYDRQRTGRELEGPILGRARFTCSIAGCGDPATQPQPWRRKDHSALPFCRKHREAILEGYGLDGQPRAEGLCWNCGKRPAESRGYCPDCYRQMTATSVSLVSDAKYSVLCVQEDETSYF